MSPRRRPTVCTGDNGKCPNLTPCPAHTPKPWATSKRRERVGLSGWEQQRQARRILREHRHVCHVCGQFGAMQVDHVIPLADGGSRGPENLRPIHAECHRRKTQAEAERARRRRDG